MNTCVDNNLITRLKGLADEYPQCDWLRDFLDDPIEAVKKKEIDNSYLDTELKYSFSEVKDFEEPAAANA